MKTKEELNALKEEFETLGKKLVGLTEEELEQITGGWTYWLHKKSSEDGGIVVGGKPYVLQKGEQTDGNSWGPSWGEKEYRR